MLLMFLTFAPQVFYFLIDREGIWILMKSPAFAFFYFIDQRLLYCSWDMNGVNRQINSIFSVNSNFLIIFLVFNKINGI